MVNKYLLNSLIGIALLLVLFSFVFILHDAKRQEVGITGMAVSTQADDDFIFTFWAGRDVSSITAMMETGMNYAGVNFKPEYINTIEQTIFQLRAKGYNITLHISAGHENGELLLGKDDSKFLNATCLDISVCEYWNNSLSIDPSYTGVLWQNTLNNTENIIRAVNPELVIFDTEIFGNPQTIDAYFTRLDTDCNCSVVKNGIGYDNYRKNWSQRLQDLKNVAKQVDNSIEVYFFGDLPENGVVCEYQYSSDNQFGQLGLYCYNSDYKIEGEGDNASPDFYVLPDLEMLEKNIQKNNLIGAVPWLSFTWNHGHSKYFYSQYAEGDWSGNIYFDPSISREAGRMLRIAGVEGFIIWPDKDTYNDLDEYWLNHSREIILGFKEGSDYIEKNKIRNPGFEAFKSKSDSIIGVYEGLRGIRFIPVFWNWSDSNVIYNDGGVYANLTKDKQSGMYSWRHTRTGDLGSRTIYSRNFSIEPGEQGDYTFSIWTKANINSGNGKIKFYLVNDLTLAEEAIGETSFQDSWNEFKGNVEVNSGTYKLKIFIEDNAGQKVDIYFDSVSLIKGFMAIECGDGSCNGNENCSSCPQDCGNCSLVNATSCQERGYYCLPSVNCSFSDRRDYNCDSGVCCSKLPTINTTIIIQSDKTCSELQGKICNASQYCNGTISWAKDSNECCLGNCETEESGNGKAEPKNNLWFYGFLGGIIVAIIGVVSYLIYEVNKRRGW